MDCCRNEVIVTSQQKPCDNAALLSPPTVALYWFTEHVNHNITRFYWPEKSDVTFIVRLRFGKHMKCPSPRFLLYRFSSLPRWIRWLALHSMIGSVWWWARKCSNLWLVLCSSRSGQPSENTEMQSASQARWHFAHQPCKWVNICRFPQFVSLRF